MGLKLCLLFLLILTQGGLFPNELVAFCCELTEVSSMEMLRALVGDSFQQRGFALASVGSQESALSFLKKTDLMWKSPFPMPLIAIVTNWLLL